MTAALALFADLTLPTQGILLGYDLTGVSSYWIRGAFGGLVVSAIFIWLMRRTRIRTEDATLDNGGDFFGDEASANDGQRPDMVVPRAFEQSPFSSDPTLEQLAEEIKIAAQASRRLGRAFGLMYFELIHTAAECAEAENHEAIESLIEKLKQQLRNSDHVGVFNGKEIVVCICLLMAPRDLETIASRLWCVVKDSGLINGDPADPAIGYAIYPRNGYEGAQLIAAARADYQKRAR
jgi:GGDEF domain-containing protein